MKLTWQTMVDALCFIVVLRFLMAWLLASKRVLRIALTLMAVGLFLFTVNSLELPLTRGLTTALAAPMILLLLLSYLPEIRRAYEDAHLFSFLGNLRKDSDLLLTHLVPALSEMCQKRIGAILVFPGRTDLKAHLSGGEAYDARLTHSLLISLFNTHAPRHDGAAVIEGNRITHVAALLPLSELEIHPEEWGTRHLAALGLSEKCDADILVVSEERGVLSHVSQGELNPIDVTDPDRLEEELSRILHQESSAPKRQFRARFSIGLWLLAIAIGVVAVPTLKYVQVHQSAAEIAKTTMVLEVPVTFVSVPENLYVDKVGASSVRVFISVPESQTNIPPNSLSVAIDLRDYPIKNKSVLLGSDMLKGAMPGWEVTGYEPENLELLLREARVMDLKPEPLFTELRPTLKVAAIKGLPESLRVLVKDSKIEPNRRLQTAPINLSEITEPGTYSLKARLELPASIRLLDKNEEPELSFTAVIEEAKPLRSSRP
jgi:diadenylate cyclase